MICDTIPQTLCSSDWSHHSWWCTYYEKRFMAVEFNCLVSCMLLGPAPAREAEARHRYSSQEHCWRQEPGRCWLRGLHSFLPASVSLWSSLHHTSLVPREKELQNRKDRLMPSNFCCCWCARSMPGEGGCEFLICVQEGFMPRRNSLCFPCPCHARTWF